MLIVAIAKDTEDWPRVFSRFGEDGRGQRSLRSRLGNSLQTQEPISEPRPQGAGKIPRTVKHPLAAFRSRPTTGSMSLIPVTLPVLSPALLELTCYHRLRDGNAACQLSADRSLPPQSSCLNRHSTLFQNEANLTLIFQSLNRNAIPTQPGLPGRQPNFSRRQPNRLPACQNR